MLLVAGDSTRTCQPLVKPAPGTGAAPSCRRDGLLDRPQWRVGEDMGPLIAVSAVLSKDRGASMAALHRPDTGNAGPAKSGRPSSRPRQARLPALSFTVQPVTALSRMCHVVEQDRALAQQLRSPSSIRDGSLQRAHPYCRNLPELPLASRPRRLTSIAGRAHR
jgi:hypothetical protein